jgi:hypothetical protein
VINKPDIVAPIITIDFSNDMEMKMKKIYKKLSKESDPLKEVYYKYLIE